jgi:tetratricopeptide (TPR) repeat protein
MISDDVDEQTNASRQALRGAAAFLSNHRLEASSLLLASMLDDDPEIGVWRAALTSSNREWETAADKWRDADEILNRYPPSLKLKLGLMAIEAAIEVDDEDMIRRGFRRLKTLARNPHDADLVLRLRALRAERQGDVEGARVLLEELAQSRNHQLRNTAKFRLESLDSATGPKKLEDLDKLGKNLPLWRGHPDEAAMMDALAARYREASQPRKALSLWQRLIELHPETANDAAIIEARQATYVQALTQSDAVDVDPFEAYSIYLDFNNVLPDLSDNGAIFRDLAQHLSELDLLGEAAQVLQPLIKSPVGPVERAEIGAKMAKLLLEQDRAEAALSILGRTASSGTTFPVVLNEERELTRARILTKLGRTEDALKRIQDIQTLAARRLRAELTWAEQNWPRLTAAIEAVLADPNLPHPLSVEDQKLVLWLAIAEGRQGRTESLQKLRRQHTDNMRTGPWAEAFAVATQIGEGGSDVRSAMSDTGAQLTELRRFRKNAKTNP